jgi:hypothetical protein
MLDFQNRSLLSLDLPGFAYIGNGVQMFADGDMALAGTAFYSAGNGATLSKQSGAPGYYQCLRVAVNVLANPYCANTGMAQIVGQVYRLTGVGRGDGVNGRPLVLDSGATFLFQGTTSTSWQPFDVTFTAVGAGCYFFNYAASGYAEFTNLRIELAPASTRNLGTLGGYAQLGDGYAAASFPTQVFPHGMSFDGASDYLLYPDNAALTFGNGVADQPFSVEVLVMGSNFEIGKGFQGTTQEWAMYSSGAVGARNLLFALFTSGVAYMFRTENPSIRNNVLNHFVGTYDGSKTVAGIALYSLGVSCASTTPAFVGYAGMSPLGAGVYINLLAAGSYYSGNIYNAAVYPFALQPGEVAQLYALRRATLNRGF